MCKDYIQYLNFLILVGEEPPQICIADSTNASFSKIKYDCPQGIGRYSLEYQMLLLNSEIYEIA